MMDEENALVWPNEPPPPYGKEGEKAYAEWEKKAEAFSKALEAKLKESKKDK
jgi:hypothetical protein